MCMGQMSAWRGCGEASIPAPCHTLPRHAHAMPRLASSDPPNPPCLHPQIKSLMQRFQGRGSETWLLEASVDGALSRRDIGPLPLVRHATLRPVYSVDPGSTSACLAVLEACPELVTLHVVPRPCVLAPEVPEEDAMAMVAAIFDATLGTKIEAVSLVQPSSEDTPPTEVQGWLIELLKRQIGRRLTLWLPWLSSGAVAAANSQLEAVAGCGPRVAAWPQWDACPCPRG